MSDAPSHPRTELDKELTSPLRLSIAAALAKVGEAEFSAIRDAVALIASEMRSSTDARWWIDYRTVHLPDLILRELSARAASLAPTAHAEAARGDR